MLLSVQCLLLCSWKISSSIQERREFGFSVRILALYVTQRRTDLFLRGGGVARVSRPPMRSPKSCFWVTATDDDETTNSSVHLVIDYYDTIALLVVLLHCCFNHLHKRKKGQEKYKKYPRVIDCGLLHLFQFEKDIN